MSANIKASVDGTQAIIGVGGVDQMTVSNAGVVTANSFVGNVTGNITGNVTGNITGGGTFSGNASSSTALATGSSTSRTLANRFADVVNVKDFGAVGDGVSDDTAAIQAAVTFAASSGSLVQLGAGTYKASSSITSSSLKIAGQGVSGTTINFTGATGGFIVTQGVISNKVEIRDLKITAGASVVDRAIKVDCTAQVLSGPQYVFQPPVPSGYILSQRNEPRALIHNIVIEGSSGTNFFDVAIEFYSCGWWSVDNITITGSITSTPQTFAGIGILCRGKGLPVETYLTNSWIYNTDQAVFFPDYNEGMFVSHVHAVNCRHGFAMGFYDSFWSTVPQANCSSLNFNIHDCHISSHVRNILLNGNQGMINNNLLYQDCQGLYATAPIGVQTYGGSDLIVSGNQFSKQGPQNPNVTSLYIESTRVTVSGNSFLSASAGVELAATADDIAIDSNKFAAITTGIIARAGSSGMVTNSNQWLNVTTPYLFFTGAVSVEPTFVFAAPTRTLTGGAAYESFTVAIPLEELYVRPSFGDALEQVNGGPPTLIGCLDYVASTTTSLVYNVRPISGGNIVAGTHTFMCRAYAMP